MEVPVVLLEFEGVLTDTRAVREAALAESLAVDGLELTPTLAAIAHGRTTEDAVRRIRSAAGMPAGKGLTLTAGARPALEKLAATARCAIVTRASRREVEFVLGLAGLEGVFRPVIALEDATPPKPDAAPYRAALARIAQLFPGQQLKALAVEDSVVGVRAARAAGITTVAIGPFEAHEAMEADAWVESIVDLTPERVRALAGIASGKR
jgi:HAD superfamily hydrolase (TIGR01509 family)